MSYQRRPKSDCYHRSRPLQEKWKAKTATLPDEARQPGTCWIEVKGTRKEVGPFPICLPTEYATHNLTPSVRAQALRMFARHAINWHMVTPGPAGELLPSTHLLDSQVQCVNVLLSLAQDDGLLDLARRVVPEAEALVAVEDENPVAIEWNGLEDYLGEWQGDPSKRPRGSMSTNADALVVAERRGGGRTGILIEWKFTENYPDPLPYTRRRNGRDRRDTYRPHYEGADSPFAVRPDISAYFHEPHYQLMRQALLGAAMVRAGEFGIDQVVLLHLVPAGNRTLRTTVPEGLRGLGVEIDEVWQKLLPGPVVRYACMDTEPLFGATPELAERYRMLA
jgi:Restriction Endonuclease associating with ARP